MLRIEEELKSQKIEIIESERIHSDELYLTVNKEDFKTACLSLHKLLKSAVIMFFAEDMRAQSKVFRIYCVFLDTQNHSWVVVRTDLSEDALLFSSLAKDIYSASIFEREIKEMFGIMPQGCPDLRRLRLHDEVWPEGFYPLRKDSVLPKICAFLGSYQFRRVEGNGVFEVGVGPVHAGIIGPGHFRFSVVGEPIINLELRLGWTHRGIEKLLEGKDIFAGVKIFECISGDTAFGYSSAYCQAIEKILKVNIPLRAQYLRVIFLEFERIYNHINSLGGIALDVGFSFPAQFASLIKERLLQLHERISGSRYLKGINTVGGVQVDIEDNKAEIIRKSIFGIQKDILELEKMLYSSTSFMDRVDSTGILRKKTAQDLGVTGLAARSSGIALDMRKVFGGIYEKFTFNIIAEQAGDVCSRMKVRFWEIKESLGLINQGLEKLKSVVGTSGVAGGLPGGGEARSLDGVGIGCVEAWRGMLRVWCRIDKEGRIIRCKIVDPSFHNWEGLSFAALGNIIPDFPLCNKSFDLSYAGNDL
ncbi:MAG: NADH-quinone oxidoreductase subunit C [Candidatus Omnitrophota bacterium]|nr:NADH-quinone oxidoreductase subunit C [Candidatus Omnitrophota bacterium]